MAGRNVTIGHTVMAGRNVGVCWNMKDGQIPGKWHREEKEYPQRLEPSVPSVETAMKFVTAAIYFALATCFLVRAASEQRAYQNMLCILQHPTPYTKRC